MPRHQWTKDDIRIIFATCKANANKEDRLRIQFRYILFIKKYDLNLKTSSSIY